MLTLGIRYLNGWVMATHPANRDIPEWPPHPDRVFMALAAAHFETDGDVAERQVLEWLEGLGPPTLDCSGADFRTSVTTFVPVNDSASPISKKGKPLMESQSMGVGRDRQARQFPMAIPQSDEVRLSWMNAVANAEQSQSLSELCSKVTHIGHSGSMVQMWVEDAAESPEKDGTASEPESCRMTFDPQAIGRFRLRIPAPGRLHDLEARYNRADVEEYSAMQQKLTEPGMKSAKKKEIQTEIDARFGDQVPETRRPDSALWSGYDQRKVESPDKEFCATHFANLIVLRQVGGRRFGLESTLQLTQALRNTVMKNSGVQPVPDWLSGHQSDGRPAERDLGHMAFIPLPHVGWNHADGHLLGMALVPPRDVDRYALAAALHGVLFDQESGEAASMTLTLGKAGECVLEVVDGSESQAGLDPITWTQPSTRWATVTPIAFDRHAKNDNPWDEIAEMIERATRRIGLPKPADIIPAPVSMFIGSPTAGEMPRINRKTGGQIRQTHAILTFSEQVSGPILLGAGRYRGYGLCRPLIAGRE